MFRNFSFKHFVFLVEVDGGWSNYSNWTGCTSVCGGGTKLRTRSCDNPAPQLGGKGCEGDAVEIKTCNPEPCSGWLPYLFDDVTFLCFTCGVCN